MNLRTSKKKERDSALEALLHSEHTVYIEKMAVGGAGVARLKLPNSDHLSDHSSDQFSGQSIVVFIDQAAPYETLKIRITHVEKNFLRGQPIEILEPAPSRRKAPCPVYDQCGGCNWQHFSEDEQLAQKEQILIDLFKKFLPQLELVLSSSVKSPLPFNYRNRIQLKQLQLKLGYFKRGSHEIVDIDSCLIADARISENVRNVKQNLRSCSEIKKFEFRLNTNEVVERYPIGDVGEGLAFSQVNNLVNEKLVESVLQAAAQAVARLEEGKKNIEITELFAGAGNFTFALLKRLQNVQIASVEMNDQLTGFAAQRRLAENFQKRLTVFTASCENFVRRRRLSSNLVLLDPPRSGCGKAVMDAIADAQPQSVIYVSCHPSFLVRDLQRLILDCPAYRIRQVQIFDMFPQTDHFETLVWLDRSTDLNPH